MALSEIEKLERRYAENPQGLTFAPLAEVHRKTGDIPRALELLKPGLSLHPDYIPASIVLGRCHLDLGELPAAETAFTHVLGLDGENVIALKALADITERQGRFDEAERWLRTLLAIDRSNDDARDQLERIEATRRQTASAAVIVPTEPPPETLAQGETMPTVPETESIEMAAGEPAASASDTEPAISEPQSEHLMGWVTESDTAEAAAATPLELEDLGPSVEAEGPRPEGIQLEQPVTLEDTVEPIAGLVGRDDHPDVGSFDHVTDFRVETAEDIVLNSSGGSEFQVANAAEELLGIREPESPAAPPEPAHDLEPARTDAEDSFFADRSRQFDDTVPPAALGGPELESTATEPGGLEQATSQLARPEGSAAAEPPAAEPPAAEPPAAEPPAAEPPAAEPPAAEPPAAASPVEGAPVVDEPITAEAPIPEWAREPSPAAGDSWTPPWSRPREPEPQPEEPVPAVSETWLAPVAEQPVVEPSVAEAPAAAAPAIEPAAHAEPDLVVTASMADLLLQQGHTVEALTVYRLLDTRNSEPRYREKIAELERLTSPPEPPPSAASGTPAPTPAPTPAYSVRETQGQSVQAFLRNLLAARPPAATGGSAVHASPRSATADTGGAPTRPAHDSLSLSSVFGEESGPTQPAVPAAGGAPSGGVSYDEFFSGAAASGAAGGATTPRPARAPDSKNDDLDQFHAWLQNLKR